MKPLALTGIYLASAGLVTLAVEVYDYDAGFLILWAIAGLGLATIALLRR